MSQKPLFDPGPPDGNLTDRQRFALEHLRKTPGLTADEVGALVHEQSGRHNAGVRCDWCGKTGRAVLVALRKKKLARRTRGRGWRALHSETEDAGGYDPAVAPIPYAPSAI